MGIVISIPPVKSRERASKSRNLFVPPCYVPRDRAMLGFVNTRLDKRLCRSRGLYSKPCQKNMVKHQDHETCLCPPRYVHRDRAMLGFVDAPSSLTHPFPFPRGRGWSSGRPPTVSVSRTIIDQPAGATKALETETKRDSAYLMIDTNLRRTSSWMAW
jgi:hypothetical protein